MLEFDPEKHEYRHRGKFIPSVTQIIKPLYNYGKVNQEVMAVAADRGKRAHAMTEKIDAGESEQPDFDIIGHIESYQAWLGKYKPEIIKSEERMMHAGYDYAGTPDRIVRIKGKVYAVDLKTTAYIMPQHGVQVAAYCMLADVNISEHSNAIKPIGMTVRLTDEGLPEVKIYSALEDRMNRNIFMSCLNIWKWKQENN
jgi:hypothetical protein